MDSLLLCYCISFHLGCTQKNLIKIGFNASLNCHVSDLGVLVRNALFMSIEQLDGGLKGYELHLYIKDDGHNLQIAKKVLKELLEEGVQVVVGPVTSEMMIAIRPLAEERKALLMSLLVSKKKGSQIPILFSGWAMGQGFLQYAGLGAEGVFFVNAFHQGSKKEKYQYFHEQYQDTYGDGPNFLALFGYGSWMVLLEAIKDERTDLQGIIDFIKEKGVFSGLQDDFYMDGSGDNHQGVKSCLLQQGSYNRIDDP